MKSISKWLMTAVLLVALIMYTSNHLSPDSGETSSAVEKRERYFSSELEPASAAKKSETNSILNVIFRYQKGKSKLMTRVTPMDEAYFYHLNIAEEILPHASYNDERISFYWNNQPIGDGVGERYELIECFVGQSGTELIIFAMKGEQKIVFHNNSRPKSPKGEFWLGLSREITLNEFMETTQDSQSIQSIKPGSDNSVISTIFNYQKAKNEMFLMAIPTDEDKFYGWQVPGAVLDIAFYEGKQISFRWYDYTIGEGEEYQLIECFINPRGTDLIVFAMKDGKRYVFHNTTPPEEDRVNLELSTDPLLNTFMEVPS